MGGAGVYAEAVTKELVKLGHEVTVFTPNIIETEDKNSQNLNIIRIDLNKNLPFKALQFWLKLPKVLKDQHKFKKFDLVHINGISYGFLKKRLLNIPQILTVHHTVKDAIINNQKSTISRILDFSGENNFLLPITEKKAVKSVDKIIAVSEFTKKQIVKYYGVKNDKITVIYNGIDKKRLNILDDDLTKFKNNNNLLNKKCVLFVGRIDDHRKGLDLLLKAFKQVLNNLDAVLIVVGNGNNKKPVEMCKNLGISDNVIFKGFVDESTLQLYYKSCDVYVCPSKLEGFGLTILEALSNGAPVIASNVGAIPEIIKEGENGFLVDAHDSKQLAKRICSILNDKVLKDKIKLNNTVYEPRSWIKSAEEIQNLYNSLIGEKELE